MSFTGKTGVVVQMRLDSTRLPGKALLPLAGTTVAGAVMRRLRGVPADAYVLATDADGARVLGAVAESFGFSVFAGPKDDVLARYAMAAGEFGLDRIVRATGDNPFVSVELAREAIVAAENASADYVGLVGMPTGMGVEVMTMTALAKAAKEAASRYDREHVCPFIYGHPDEFVILRPPCPPSHYFPAGRVTIDTPSDYGQALAIIESVGNEPTDAMILAWLRSAAKDVPA